MPQIIQCPSCQRELQVPEDFVGRPVKCPSCGVNFVTQAGTSAAPTPLPRISEPATYAPPGYYGSAPPAGTPGMVLTPAIFLLIVGMLCFLVDVLGIVLALNPQMTAPAEDLPPFLQEMMEKQQDMVAIRIVFAAGFMFASFIIMLGAIQMMRMRTWPVALAGSILAILHIQSCCCLLGLPVGIWSLVVLCRADVRSLFQ